MAESAERTRRRLVAGDKVFVVLVECACEDRWWMQPEGGYFPICQTCGEQAAPRGPAPGTVSHDEWAAGRRANALGAVVMLEQDAVREVLRDGAD